MNAERFYFRTWVVTAGIIGLAIIFLIKLVYLQMIHGQRYVDLADRQYVTNTSQLFDRGNIYFSQKDGALVSAATLKSGFRIAINTKVSGDPRILYEQIGEWVPLEREDFLKRASKPNDPYVELAANVPEDAASRVSGLKLPGVSVARMNWRFYPAGEIASQTVGFMAFKGDEYTGRYGLERFYNTPLARTDERLYVNFFAEVFSDIRKFISSDQEIEGDIVTTLEPSVQQQLEHALDAVQVKWNAERVGGIIMNPQTGAVYAMGLDHSFNLNETKVVTNVSWFNNPLVEDRMEMGSIMKPIIMGIALDQGVVTPTTTYFDQGFVKVADRTIYNFDKKGRGKVDMQTVLNQSLNTGMVFVMQHMQKTAFKNQWMSFGFGQKTGIDLPGDGAGLVSNLDTNRDVEYANASFGQGLAVTPVAMIRALAALGNGGHLVTPHLGARIEYPSGLGKDLAWPVTGQLIKPETSVTITDMLVNVFDNYNQGEFKMDHYSIAAKTGTAQIPNPAGGYYNDRNLHTFMAYFPARNPQFMVFLFAAHPQNGARFSSETLLPPFTDLAKFLINYYNVAPDR